MTASTCAVRETAGGAEAGPRRLYYGWVMLPVAMAGLIATSPGQTFGVSIFNEPMRTTLALSHGQFAAAYMLGTLLAALPITWIGGLMDRYGLRYTMLAAVFLLGLACLVTSLASSWLTLFVAFFLLRMLGPGALAFLSGNTLAFWFDRRLGLVEGIRHLGMAGAMAAIPALNLWLVASFGWRSAYAILGVSIWAVMLPLVLLLFRNRPEDLGQTIDGRPAPRNAPADDAETASPGPDFTLGQAVRTRSFWIVSGGTAMFGLIHTALFFSIVPIFLDRGLSQADAAGMLTAFAVSLAAMHLVGGALADRFPAPYLLATALGGLALAVLVMRVMTDPWMAQLAGVVFGVSQGLFFGASNPLWARYFGRRHLGKVRGLLVTVNVAASSLGPLIAGTARDVFGNYHLALALFAALPVPLLLLSLFATPPENDAGSELTNC